MDICEFETNLVYRVSSRTAKAIQKNKTKQAFQVREMAQWLKDIVALPEDWVQFPAPTWQLTTICDFSPRDFDTLLISAGIHVMCMHACRQNVHTHKTNKSKGGELKYSSSGVVPNGVAVQILRKWDW